MSDCGCEQARRDLEEYLRHEVCTTSEAEIAEHLAHCTGCQDEAHLALTLTEVIARACKETAPDELRDLVIAKLRAQPVV